MNIYTDSLELRYTCLCGNEWTEFSDYVCSSECEECGEEDIMAVEVKELF